LPVTTIGAQRASRRHSILLAIGLALGFLVTIGPLSASAAYAPWLSVEQWYLGLVNCTRTGGWVTNTGSCLKYGSGYYSPYVRPLVLGTALSDYVTRPYARALAATGVCSHTYGGTTVSSRLLAKGFHARTWGENIGCRDGYSSTKTAVLTSHLVFQNEKSTNGGHWANIKNSGFKYIGIGVWVTSGRERLVTDFYTPAW
jgi:hypothetical protein